MASPAHAKFRFLRVLEYIGTAERLNEARERRQVKGTQHFGKDLSIFEGILGDAASPVIGAVRLKLCEMIVAVDECKVFPDDDTARAGYHEACQELMALIEFQPKMEKFDV